MILKSVNSMILLNQTTIIISTHIVMMTTISKLVSRYIMSDSKASTMTKLKILIAINIFLILNV
jgi:hypothetical protein